MSPSLGTKFTVVIPTRERIDTLRSSLQTCLAQAYDNLTIIVSDNFSQDGTEEFVRSIKDQRLKYLNTGRRLSMSHNWEFALGHVGDGYVMFLGDDDGLLPNALRELDILIQETGAKAVGWMSATYGWPTCNYPWIRNRLKIPLGQGYEWRDTRRYISRLLSFKTGYEELPMVYGFFVDIDCLRSCQGSDGVFFRSMTPDIYSAIAVSSAITRYLFLFKPYSIYGISHHSTGASQFNSSFDDRPVLKFYQEKNIPFHERLVLTSLVSVLTTECFFQAKDVLPGLKGYEVNLWMMLKAALKESARIPAATRGKAIESLIQISKKNNLGPDAIKMIKNFKPNLLGKVIPVISLQKFFYKVLFDGKKNDLHNIYEATIFCHDALRRRAKGELFIRERVEFFLYLFKKGWDVLFRRNKEKWGY